MKCKIIFLDVDGVLNNFYTPDRVVRGLIGIEDKFVKHLSRIVKYTRTKEIPTLIVLTSTWKQDWKKGVEQQDNIYGQYLVDKLANFNLEIFDKTIDLHNRRERGQSILNWIEQFENQGNKIVSYTILDDDSFDYIKDVDNLFSHFVRTNNYTIGMNREDHIVGLTQKYTKQAIKMLNHYGQ